MPFVFILVGLLFLVSAIRGTDQAMFALVKSEFWGTNSFVPWASAIVILAMVGYVKTVKPIADGMILLVILAMVIANKGGFFTAINKGLQNPVAPSVDAATGNPASGYTPAGAALAAGTTLTPATANADAAAAANQPNATAAPATPASPYSPATTTLLNWWQNIFGSSPAY